MTRNIYSALVFLTKSARDHTSYITETAVARDIKMNNLSRINGRMLKSVMWSRAIIRTRLCGLPWRSPRTTRIFGTLIFIARINNFFVLFVSRLMPRLILFSSSQQCRTRVWSLLTVFFPVFILVPRPILNERSETNCFSQKLTEFRAHNARATVRRRHEVNNEITDVS